MKPVVAGRGGLHKVYNRTFGRCADGNVRFHTMKKCFALICLTIAAAATPAFAAKPVGNGGGAAPPVGLRACAFTDVSPTALACSGFFAGNLLSGNARNIAAQRAGLNSIGLTWDGQFSDVTKINSLGGLTTVNFSTADQNPLARLYGDTWVGFHFGNGAGLGGNATAFYKFNAGTTGLASFLLNIQKGSSGAVLYRTGVAPGPGGGTGGGTGAVPEPASWAMMIAGFGLVGASMRRRRPAVASA